LGAHGVTMNKIEDYRAPASPMDTARFSAGQPRLATDGSDPSRRSAIHRREA
jgi:hypothetical protein